MYQIPRNEYNARLRRWHSAPDRHVRETLLAGKLITEHWSTGVCRLRMVRHKEDMELYGDRGVPGYPPRDPFAIGKIAFKNFGEGGP